MKLLAIDTTGWNCSVALWNNGQELAFQESLSERDQASLLPSLVDEILKHHKLDQIIVNVGPGSFTGIRIGLSFAKGLAMGLDISLKGMDSFTSTYLSLEPLDDVLILIDAHRQDVFAQRYLKGTPQGTHSLERKDIEKILLEPAPPILSGSGVRPFLDGLSYQEASSSWRGAQKLAHAFFKDPSLAIAPLPLYVREADITCSPKSTPSFL
ncbi:MAG: tRNA (adenosine(37)-N6)-threonylcarbamoyltransferase complex dimerization subunit type 1 TsaB [Proteobacteria bacterium]|nr:tRNA (adenosine(37)-N6)-threonylcarbamoyltransferase complex dimerization subunit type 1 TsaB [Pseudomonadota bacterium]